MNFNDVAIASVKRSDYRIHFWYLSNNDAINIMNSSNLNEKSGLLQVFLPYMKMTEEMYHQISRETIINRSKTYYNDNNDILKERLRNKCRKFSEKEKNIKTEYGRNRYHNMSDKKNKD